jgi:hypothetical protein
VNHRPFVGAFGDYSPGCTGVFMYQQEAYQGYDGISIHVSYRYTYTTYDTTYAYGIKVYRCTD